MKISSYKDRRARLEEIREAIRNMCSKYGDDYWKEKDTEKKYPEEFVSELTSGGWLSMLIPEEYGGSGLGISEAGVVLEEINRSGGNGASAHAQMYTMGALLRHGGQKLKETWLPRIASGELKLQAFGVTEPGAGSDTTNISTFATRDGDSYIISGQKIFVSRLQHSDLMLLLVRTTKREGVQRKTDGLTLLLLDLRDARTSSGLHVKPIPTMINHETNEVSFDGARVGVENRIGEEGDGFHHVLSGLNAERILISSECIGDGLYFVDKATDYAKHRIVFDRPIGKNQGVQFPIAKALIAVRAAALARDAAAEKFDLGEECGQESNMAKYLSSEASWEAANVAMNTFGGYGYAVSYNIERKFREARLFIVAPVSNNLILSYVAEHVLGLPRSY